MPSKPSPAPYRADDVAWLVSAGTRQGAREADACMAADDFLYVAPSPPPRAAPPARDSTAPSRTPAR